MEPLYVLDLFSGSGGFSQAFKDRGHKVYTVDFNRDYGPSLCINIDTLTPEILLKEFNNSIDMVLASPDCRRFSVAALSRNWELTKKGEYVPRNIETRISVNTVKHTLGLISELSPSFWILENPRGMLRKVIGEPQGTITFCQYGEIRMKPTDLWGVFPPGFIPRKCDYGALCHIPGPRGSRTGTQGLKTAYERAKIPYKLSFELCLAAEKALKG